MPKKSTVRPTTDFAKEGLFNWLNNYTELRNLNVLDLFAGTGNISLEFISRGAAQVFSVDKNKTNVSHLNEIKQAWNIENLKVALSDVFKFIKFHDEQFDLIFADPPYQFKFYEDLIERIMEGNLLTKEGLFILEHSVRLKNIDARGLIASKSYGQVAFSIFTKV